ncbi:cytosolic acyl coenzyme A thioester hydrolase isoform X4 [Heterocephalus glaber]|uniref:Cytosolic acyl coenzyme A thioester hydrolase isoform X4 n=1 Tax=Heterocephalus glaber TaxID=10181 RepID=A0AAX6RS74_HETGA|nr:cytosolic acyl coenzyme A thioester hydrolase isoform X4 [Heterocephalus glaber]
MAPPPPSPSMAPPGLIHSTPGPPDACAPLSPPRAAASAAAAASMSGPVTETPSAIQICRIMRPDDANVAGNVHGGTILKMIEEAGAIISTRHCNSQNGYSRQEQEEEGRKRYEAQKLERMETKWRNGDIVQPILNPEPNTVSYSQSSLIHLVGPSDCTLHGFVHGGVTMKLMDEVAGIVAARHCKTNIVTASVDAINFHDKIRKGCVITISGRMTFTSNKSMEIEVLVDADPVVDNLQKRYRAASAFFTYVSLSQEGKPLPVPQLVPETEDEKKRFEDGKGRYLQVKAKRQAQVEPQP